MKESTEKELMELKKKLSAPKLTLIDNYEEKMEVLKRLSELPGVESPLKALLEETMLDLEKIQKAAKKAA
jgi:hypothetical protein